MRELLGRIDSRELSEWMAYWRIEPFGEEWLRNAVLCMTINRANGGKEPLQTWMPYRGAPIEPQSEAKMESILMAHAKRQNRKR